MKYKNSLWTEHKHKTRRIKSQTWWAVIFKIVPGLFKYLHIWFLKGSECKPFILQNNNKIYETMKLGWVLLKLMFEFWTWTLVAQVVKPNLHISTFLSLQSFEYFILSSCFTPSRPEFCPYWSLRMWGFKPAWGLSAERAARPDRWQVRLAPVFRDNAATCRWNAGTAYLSAGRSRGSGSPHCPWCISVVMTRILCVCKQPLRVCSSNRCQVSTRSTSRSKHRAGTQASSRAHCRRIRPALCYETKR